MASGTRASSSFMTVTISSGDIWSSCIVRGLRVSVVDVYKRLGHSYTKPDREYCMTRSRTALYKAQIAKLKERYAGKMDILCGLEWDLFSDDDRRITTISSAAPIMCLSLIHI